MSARIYLLALVFLVVGCARPSAPEPPSAVAVQEAVSAAGPSDAAPGTVDEAWVSTLLSADAKDGSEDKVVSQCALCSLHMEGSDQHVVTVGEYSLQMCSAECKSRYEEDPQAALTALADVVK